MVNFYTPIMIFEDTSDVLYICETYSILVGMKKIFLKFWILAWNLKKLWDFRLLFLNEL